MIRKFPLEIIHVLHHYYRTNGNSARAAAMLEAVREGIIYRESHWTCFASHALRQLLGPVAEEETMPADIKTDAPQVGRNSGTFQKLSILNTCLNYAPDAHRVFNARGKCYLSLGHYEHGVFDLTTASILASDDSDSWYHLALCYFLCGDYENAEKAQASGTPHALAMDSVCGINFWHWNTLMLLGRREEAQKVLEAYYQHLPRVDDFDAYYELTLVQGGHKPMSEVLDALAKLPSNSALTPINRST